MSHETHETHSMHSADVTHIWCIWSWAWYTRYRHLRDLVFEELVHLFWLETSRRSSDKGNQDNQYLCFPSHGPDRLRSHSSFLWFFVVWDPPCEHTVCASGLWKQWTWSSKLSLNVAMVRQGHRAEPLCLYVAFVFVRRALNRCLASYHARRRETQFCKRALQFPI